MGRLVGGFNLVHYLNSCAQERYEESGCAEDGFKQTMCGYARKNVTSVVSKVTCKKCLREMIRL